METLDHWKRGGGPFRAQRGDIAAGPRQSARGGELASHRGEVAREAEGYVGCLDAGVHRIEVMLRGDEFGMGGSDRAGAGYAGMAQERGETHRRA